MMKAPSWNSGSSFNIGGGSWSMPSSAGGGGYSWTVSSNNPGMHSLGGDCWQFNTTNYVKARDYVEGRTGTNNAPPAKPINYNAEALMKTWSKKSKRVTQAFCNRVIQAAQKIKCDPNDLMALMYGESGFNHRVVNGIDAVGLIQFMPQTRKGLGVTKEQLINMSMVQQMDYVEKCLLKSKRMAGFSDDHVLTGGEIGALTFLPAYAKRDVLTRRGEKYYRYNSGLDWNKDGVITKDDLGRRLKSFYA